MRFPVILQNSKNICFREYFGESAFKFRSVHISYVQISEYICQNAKMNLHCYSDCYSTHLGECSSVQNQLKTISRFYTGNNNLRYTNAYLILPKCFCYILPNINAFVANQISPILVNIMEIL